MALFGRPISRLDELKKTVAKDPTSRQFLALSDEYRRAGKLREAAETLEKGLRENPGYVTAYVALGRIHQLSQRFDDAITAFQAALRTDRDNLVAIRQLADCYLKKGEKVEAIKKLKLFRGLQPGDREVEEIIQQLELELSAPKPRPAVRAETWPSIPVPRPSEPKREAAPLPASSRQVSVTTAPISASPADAREPMLSTAEVANPSSTPRVSDSGYEFLRAFDFPATDGSDTSTEGGSTEILPASDEVKAAVPNEVHTPLPSEVQSAQSTEPISRGSGMPSRSAEIFDLTYEGSVSGDSSREEVASRESVPEEREEPHAPIGRELETEPLPPIAEGAVDVDAVNARVAPPVITETLAELYRTQGYVADARQTYQGLAEAERDPARAREFRDRAAELPAEPKRGPAARLREWATHLPGPLPTRIEDLRQILETLVESVPGVRAAALTDLEGLPLVAAGEEVTSSGMEALIAELTAFWKGVHRTRDEVGAGLLSSLTLSATDGAAVVTSVSSEYSLILRVDRAVPLGRIRYEAARAAGILRPALG
jgi:predicted regulator of Ras-like GTPase activity (Roadblock/LC7/MglB family)